MADMINRPLSFAYSGNNCVSQPTILPDLYLSSGERYRVEFGDRLKLGNVTLVAGVACITPASAPQPGQASTARTALFGVPFLFQKGYRITAPDFPAVHHQVTDEGIAATRVLQLPLSVPDTTFSYELRSENGKKVACEGGEALNCDVRKLQLKQGSKYRLALTRHFKMTEVATVFDKPITTLSPVSITKTSIKRGSTVYARPTSLLLSTDKKVISATARLEKIKGNKKEPVAQSLKFTLKGIEVHFKELARSTKYQLVLSDVVAEDGSTLLDSTYTLPFSMSGGPKVVGVNIGTYGVAQGTTVVVTFDQPLSTKQKLATHVTLAGGVSGMVHEGNRLYFSTSSVPLCGTFSITIGKALQSKYGVEGNSAWSYTSRALCHTISTIGYSVNGSAITAYRFGSGSSAILYVGATHGSEPSSYYLMSEWIDELEAKARDIPKNRTIIVVPAINRDGLAAGSRFNAHGVDLNRNFPTADWKKDVTVPGGAMKRGGGGSKPLSEPESRAIANYTTSLAPRLVLTYHSIAGLVTPNEAGISSPYAQTYSRMSGYYVSPKSEAGETFEYDTTGAYEDWLYEKPGIAAILVELGSNSYSQAERNFPAMWAMMK